MNVRLSTLTSAELEEAMVTLARAAQFFRLLGEYRLAVQCKSRAAECGQHLLRREADHRQNIARQLSLAPPGAYELRD